MGEVARQEYECFAGYVESFDMLPEFNDKQRSPKKWMLAMKQPNGDSNQLLEKYTTFVETGHG
jgi:hypothetical protein